MPEHITHLPLRVPLADLHCHPSLMAFLWGNTRITEDAPAEMPKGMSISRARCTLPRLASVPVGVACVAHYVPEPQLLRNWVIRVYGRLAKSPAFEKHVEWVPPLDRLRRAIAEFESLVTSPPWNYEIARSGQHLNELVGRGAPVIVHSLEGAYLLESLFAAKGAAACVEILREMSIAYVTTAHLFPTIFCPHVEALPYQFLRCMLGLRTNPDPLGRLPDIGRELLAAIDRAGILIDVTHMAPPARSDIYAMLPPGRPVLASHVGVRSRFNDPYTLDDSEIASIHARGGLIGVIAAPQWLSGKEAGPGIDQMVQTMNDIRRVTGDWNSVAIGSDFDGFTDPPDDLTDPSQFARLEAALRRDGHNVSEADVLNVLGGNVVRVLSAHWRP